MPFGFAGRAGGIEHVERVGGGDRYRIDRLRRGHQVVPVQVAALDQLAPQPIPLHDDAHAGRVLRRVQCGIEHRLVLHCAGGLDAAGGRDDDRRPGVIDPGGQFVRGEATEYDRVHRTDPRACQHGDHGLGNHRHVHHDAVALAHAQPREHPGEPRRLVQQFGVGICALRTGHRGVVDQCGLISPAVGDVAVQSVCARVQFGVGEPAVVRRVGVVEHLDGLANPGHVPRSISPERLRIGDARVEEFAVSPHSSTTRYAVDIRMNRAVGHCAHSSSHEQRPRPSGPARP